MTDMATLREIHRTVQNIRQLSPFTTQLFDSLRVVLLKGVFRTLPALVPILRRKQQSYRKWEETKVKFSR